MVVAWCLLAPCAILLALFYKSVCVQGEWFYVRPGVQYLIREVNISLVRSTL